MRVNLDTLNQFLKIAAHAKDQPVAFYPGYVATKDHSVKARVSQDLGLDPTAPGSVIIPHREAKAIVDAHKGADSAELTWTAGQISLQSGLAVTTLPATALETIYPANVMARTSVASIPLMSLPGASLALAGKALSEVLDPSSTRAYATLLRLEAGPDSVRLVACDGYRIMTYDLAITEGPQAPVAIHLAYGDAQKLFALAKTSENLALSLAEDGAQLNIESAPFSLALPVSQIAYPNYERVMPKDLPSARPFDRKVFLSQITKLIPSVAKKDPSIRLVSLQDKTLVQVPDSNAFAMLPFSLGDTSAAMYFTPSYLIAALRAERAPAGNFYCDPGDPESPVKLTVGAFVSVIVPQRAPEEPKTESEATQASNPP